MRARACLLAVCAPLLLDGHHRGDYTGDLGRSMGLTYIEATIANPARPRKTARLKFLVDSGAVYSVVPAPVLRRVGIKPRTTRRFILADGTTVTRRIGQVLFRLDGQEGASPVIFGQKDDSVLLGTVSLEALGLILDPLKRELRPLPMMLARFTKP
jgi:predicted aspartyl protease